MSENILKIVPAFSFKAGDDISVAASCAKSAENLGADAIMIIFEYQTGENPKEFFKCVRACTRQSDIPVFVHAAYFKLEDVKKLLYAGADRCIFFGENEGDIRMYQEALLRFGVNRCALFMKPNTQPALSDENAIVTWQNCLRSSFNSDISALLKENENADVLVLDIDPADTDNDYFAVKQALSLNGINVDLFKSTIDPSEFKWDENGLIPVIVQEYKTDEVLMLAYMNKESFDLTCKTGRMTYFSRSRKKLWVKGETSGHFQYVKSLAIDCDKDTILAKVLQIGAACHTGNSSCFYTKLAEKSGIHSNPEKVLNNVYDVIKNRKKNPREGSYTNYLFDKGIDKILKKVGEETTEIVIAAKNPDSEETIYETADLLYHLMVLLVEKGVTWDDILEELSKRETGN